MGSVFSKIIAGEIPCHKVGENDKFLAFLDVMPLRKGHTLVVPKVENDYIFNMSDGDIAEMMVFAKSIALKVEKKISCKRVGIAVIGLEVPHTHVHLVPMDSADDLNFTKEKLKPSQEELAETAAIINS